MKAKHIALVGLVASSVVLGSVVVFERHRAAQHDAMERDFRILTAVKTSTREQMTVAGERLIATPGAREFLHQVLIEEMNSEPPTDATAFRPDIAMRILRAKFDLDERVYVIMLDALAGKTPAHPKLKWRFPDKLARRRPSLAAVAVILQLLAPTSELNAQEPAEAVPWHDVLDESIWRLTGVFPSDAPGRPNTVEELAARWLEWWETNNDYLYWAEDYGAFVVDAEAKKKGVPTTRLRDPGLIEYVSDNDLRRRRQGLKGKYLLPSGSGH